MTIKFFDQPFDFFGYWWRPFAEDDAKPGHLTYDPTEGLRLTLLGPFSGKTPRVLSVEPTYPLLLGRVTETKLSSYITVTDCHHIGGQGIVFSLATEEFTVGRAYFGALLETSDELRFTSADVYLDHLEYWVVESRLEGAIELENDIPVRHEILFDNNETAPVPVGDASVSLSFMRTVPFGWTRTITVSELPYLHIDFGSATQVDTILRDYIFPLQNLSTLATDHPNRITALHLRRDRNVDVKLLFHHIPGPAPTRQLQYAEQMLFVTRDLALGRILPAWLNFAATHRDLCDLYFSVVYNRVLLDAAFFMLATTAEFYHRDCIGGTRLPEEEFAQRCADVLKLFKGTLRKWLKSMFGMANELSLAERVRALVAPDQSTLEAIVGDTKPLVEDIANTRNYMAHRIEKLRTKAKRQVDVYPLNAKLKLLLKACFLRELGATTEERRKILSRHTTFDSIVRQPVPQ